MLKNFNKLFLLISIIVSSNQIKADKVGDISQIAGEFTAIGGVCTTVAAGYNLYYFHYCANKIKHNLEHMKIIMKRNSNPDLQYAFNELLVEAPIFFDRLKVLKKDLAKYMVVGTVATLAGIALYKYGKQRNERQPSIN